MQNQKQTFQKKFLEQAMSFSLAMESSFKGNLLPQPYTKIHRAALVQRGLQYGVLGVVALLTIVTYFTHSKLEALRDQVKQVQKDKRWLTLVHEERRVVGYQTVRL